MKLKSSESTKIIGGVCGGLGEFLNIDPVFIRIFFIFWAMFGELSVLVYLILWVVVPSASSESADKNFEMNELGARFHQMGREIGEITRQPNTELITFAGIGLITWGVYQLVQRFIPYLDIWAYSGYVWPALLIVAGVFVIIRTSRDK